MRNELYIYLDKPNHWEVEQPIKDSVGNVIIKPDILFSMGEPSKFYIGEIDNAVKMLVNKKKIETYAELKRSNLLHNTLGYFPQLVFLTKTEGRKNRLIAMLREKQLRHIVYTLEDIK